MALPWALLSGCGAGPAQRGTAASPRATSAVPTPAVTVPPTPAATNPTGLTALSGKRTTIDGAWVQPYASYPGRIAVANDVSLLFLAVGDRAGLRVDGSRGGGELRPIQTNGSSAGRGRIPPWATIHAGTNANDNPVVTYPRCRTTKVSSCDVYALSEQSGIERPLTSVNTPSTGETEASEYEGSVAVVREQEPSLTSSDMEAGRAPHTTSILVDIGAGPTLVTQDGGRDIALDTSRGPQIAMVAAGPASAADCRPSTVRLVSANAASPGSPLLARTFPCAGGERVTGVSLLSGYLRFGVVRDGTFARAYQVPLGHLGRIQSAPLPVRAADWSPTGYGGWALSGAACGGHGTASSKAAAACTVSRVNHLDFGP